MTTPEELEPEIREELERAREESHRCIVAPIDAAASDFVDDIRERAEHGSLDSRIEEEAIGFVTKLVGWRSRDADPETGRVELARLDMSTPCHKKLDELALEFFSTYQEHTSQEEIVTEDGGIINRYTYLQSRLNGKVRLATVTRRPLTDQESGEAIEYFVAYEDVGEHHPDMQRKLDADRTLLESLGRPALQAATIVPRKLFGVAVGGSSIVRGVLLGKGE